MAGAATAAGNTHARRGILRSQEAVVFFIALAVFVGFSIGLERFLTAGNLSVLVFNMSLIGILGCGMAVVVIGRGIDLSLIAIMAVTSAVLLQLLTNGVPLGVAIPVTLVMALVMGAINGAIIAFFEVPALFATLATALVFFGASRVFFLDSAVLYLPGTYSSFIALASASVFGIPLPVLAFLCVALVLHFVLNATAFGQLTYAQGDNMWAARNSGAPIRLMIVLQYMISACAAVVGGYIFTAASGAIDMQIIRSTLIFDVVLVVVLGGVSLAGGRGSIWSVIVGTLLIGILVNGMVILNLDSSIQGIAKGVVLACAILLDRFMHPVDEETAKQGDTF